MRLNRLPQRRDPANDADPREHQGAEIIDLATRNVLPRVTQQKPGGDGMAMAAGLVFVALLGGVTLWSMNAGRLEKSQVAQRSAPAASYWPLTGAEVLPAASDGFSDNARPPWLAIWFSVVDSGAAGRL